MLLATIGSDNTVMCRLCKWTRGTDSQDEGVRRAQRHLQHVHQRVMVSRQDKKRGTRTIAELHGPRWKNDYGTGFDSR
jgi:hypothetical protein